MGTANRKEKNLNNNRKERRPSINGMAYTMEYRGEIEKTNIIPIEAYRPNENDMGIEIQAGTYVVELDEKSAQRIIDGKVIPLELKKVKKMKEVREEKGDKIVSSDRVEAKRKEKELDKLKASGKVVDLEERKQAQTRRKTGTGRDDD